MRWFAGAMLMLSLASCYQELEVRQVTGLTEGQLSLQGFIGQVDVRVYNPNGYAVKALQSDVVLYVRDQRVGEVQLPQPADLPAREESVLTLVVASEPGAIAAILKNEWMNLLIGGEVELRAEGTVTGKAWGIPVTVPVRSVERIGFSK